MQTKQELEVTVKDMTFQLSVRNFVVYKQLKMSSAFFFEAVNTMNYQVKNLSVPLFSNPDL